MPGHFPCCGGPHELHFKIDIWISYWKREFASKRPRLAATLALSASIETTTRRQSVQPTLTAEAADQVAAQGTGRTGLVAGVCPVSLGAQLVDRFGCPASVSSPVISRTLSQIRAGRSRASAPLPFRSRRESSRRTPKSDFPRPACRASSRRSSRRVLHLRTA